ncbi:fungal-specific transcription factor domain-containing protein [Fusarium tricinctum]|uniref:Fungal-specific transcription factor domain-containing protein n=1 Tax=Fusarium tricinctum TaxID=61284 RepID=A0A8K0RRE5_9HYPO|nr:fungal-specific transcription factor domain-containing protein [Fusarium tricinctum]
MATPVTSTPLSEASTCTNPGSVRSKRILPLSPDTTRESENRRKASKVSRACDHCKLKKLKCSGTLPCAGCVKRQVECQYDSLYRRGRPPTPPTVDAHRRSMSSIQSDANRQQSRPADNNPEQNTTRSSSQGPPGLETAEIEGQFFDPTSNLTFIHRAWKRLAQQNQQTDAGLLTGSENLQPLMSAGDKPFTTRGDQSLMFVDQAAAFALFEYYFENCVVTYRVLNRQYCQAWLEAVINNFHTGQSLDTGIGHAKAAIVITTLAIACFRQHRISESTSLPGGISLLSQQSEEYFLAASDLTAQETGLPRLESAQARVLQVLYLLQTSRMNQAWYVFGNTVPIVTALGLHRKSTQYRNGGRQPVDYISSECRKRTFWVLYTIDKYLAVVFGRPRFYHDDDVDQEFPDRINDEDMTPQGPSPGEPAMDCHVDSLVFHARIAIIIENVSRKVYSLKKMPAEERLAAAQGFIQQLHEWRQALPHHIGTVRPSSLIPTFSRQATALKLAYCHAVMHTTRPFLLDHSDDCSPALRACVTQCIGAAKLALEIVDGMFSEKSVLFHALWWMPYVTFCALAVVYVWDIQQRSNETADPGNAALFDLAEKCQNHLARTIAVESASRRYSIIIEELRQEARQGPQHATRPSQMVHCQQESLAPSEHESGISMDELGSMFEDQDGSSSGLSSIMNPLSQWQPTDWLDLDSSAFTFFSQLEDSMLY